MVVPVLLGVHAHVSPEFTLGYIEGREVWDLGGAAPWETLGHQAEGSAMRMGRLHAVVAFGVCDEMGGFPCGSAGKESTCNAGDPGSIPGSGRSPREGIGDPLQYSRASLVAQLVKNPPAMWEGWV